MSAPTTPDSATSDSATSDSATSDSTTPAPTTGTPYRPRRTWSTGRRELVGWTLKTYAISASGEKLETGLLDAAMAHAALHLPGATADEPAMGFITVHSGEEAVWLRVETWKGDILEQRVYRADLGSSDFQPSGFEQAAACVWELEVIHHESRAWIQHVLSDPDDPNWQAYLDDVLSVD